MFEQGQLESAKSVDIKGEHVIRGMSKEHEGIFLKAHRNGAKNVYCLLDTGSTASVIHVERSESLPKRSRPALDPCCKAL